MQQLQVDAQKIEGIKASSVKKPPLRVLMEKDDKNIILDKKRSAIEFQKLLAGRKISMITNNIEAQYSRRLSEIHQRNLPEPKLKLFSPLKKPRPPIEEEDNYEWVQETPYDIN